MRLLWGQVAVGVVSGFCCDNFDRLTSGLGCYIISLAPVSCGQVASCR